jgi:outer membrane lipopolysaccharide assembly protein LptE/RlpB
MLRKKCTGFPAPRGIVLLLLLAAFCSACGYMVRGSGRFLADRNIQSLYIPLFKNSTTRFQADLKLTEAVINEFISRGKVTTVQNAESADGVLEGEILGFDVNPIAYTGVQGSADRYSITIRVSVTLRDVKKNTILFSNPNYAYRGEYEVPEGMDFESQETEALNEIAELFAKNLVIFIVEGF